MADDATGFPPKCCYGVPTASNTVSAHCGISADQQYIYVAERQHHPTDTSRSSITSTASSWRGGPDSTIHNSGGDISALNSASCSPTCNASSAKELNFLLSSLLSISGVHYNKDRANSNNSGNSNSGASLFDRFYRCRGRRLKALSRRRHLLKRSGSLALIFLLLLLLCVFLCVRQRTVPAVQPTVLTLSFDALAEAAAAMVKPADTPIIASALASHEELLGDHSNWSVLLQHEDALSRLNLTDAQRRCLKGNEQRECDVAVMPTHVSRAALPAWTLHMVRRACANCLDADTYDTAVRGAKLKERHGVFATSAAPLGRIGPMLFAMASVTDDISLPVKLPEWRWLRRVYPSLAGAMGDARDRNGGGATRPYLAVMGVPSTDQPSRVALRAAQRETWMSYSEVARKENNFAGALLPLYLFAAMEPSAEMVRAEDEEKAATATVDAALTTEARDENKEALGEEDKTTTIPTAAATSTTPTPRRLVRLRGHTDILLPTVSEYQQASKVMESRNAYIKAGRVMPVEDVGNSESFVRRRVVLRNSYQTTDLSTSPCCCVAESRVNAVQISHLPITYIAKSIGLSVTPAVVSGAQFICHASAALWQESLTHRNAIWIDMMTDRRPTTNKKLGDTTKWGLPVEVGMSQKLILWLEYAYHAFPDVPYIMKGDDDTYLKVPQFLSDVRLLRRGRRNGRLPPPTGHRAGVEAGGGGGATSVAVYEEPDEPYAINRTACVYMGSTRRMSGKYFNAGMLFLLQRRLAQVVLEPPTSALDTDLVELASRSYSNQLYGVYKRTAFDKEDVLIGETLHRRKARAEEICAQHRVWYVREARARYHDLRKGRARPITWTTVVAHRCRPADAYFLQYFFQNEVNFAQADVSPGESREEVAREAAAAWAGEIRKTLPDAHWTHNMTTGPYYWIAEHDKVAVYNVSYYFWRNEKSGVYVGYTTKV